MSEYQYYEFCKLSAPLTAKTKKEMLSLSTRANVSTHGASYVYHYGNFRSNPKELLLKYFDVFFYISNWGCIQLMFKYPKKSLHPDRIKQYCIKPVIDCEVKGAHVLLDINFTNEHGLGWVEGEGMLSDLLPIYDEIKSKNYQFLQLVAEAQSSTPVQDTIMKNSGLALSEAQEAFFRYADVDPVNL
jgi:hypothetical protein